MSRGAPALNRVSKQMQSGPPFVPTSAENGLSVDPVTGAIVLGNDVAGNSAVLLSDRWIPMDDFSLALRAGTAAVARWNMILNDDPGFLVVENDELGSAAPLTAAGFKTRTLPGVAPFNLPFEFSTRLSNQGVGTFLLQDMSAVPTGLLNFVFRIQDAGGAGNPLTIDYSQHVTASQTLGVGTSAPLPGSRLSVLVDGDAVTTAATYKNGDVGVNSAVRYLLTNNVNSAIFQLNGSTHAAEANSLLVDNSLTAGDILFSTGTGLLRVKNNTGVLVNGGNAAGTALDVNGGITFNDATAMLYSAVAMNNGAGVGVGTLLNAPAAGNPTKWIPFNDAGTIRSIPSW